MSNIVITGAAGFIGMHASIKFIESGWHVIGVDNLNDYYDVEYKKSRLNQIIECQSGNDGSFTFYDEDINSQVWKKLSEKSIEIVLHLAAQAGVRYSIENPKAYLDSNILGFQKVMDFVKENDIKKFMYASSSSVYGKNRELPLKESHRCDKPESFYATTKIANELMAYSYWKTWNICSMGLRFFTVYGPWGRPDMAPMIFTKAAFEKKKIKVFNYGRQKRDFTYIDDIVNSIFLLSNTFDRIQEPEIINVGNGEPVQLNRFIELIESHTGLVIDKEMVSAQIGDVVETHADTSKLKALTGHTPEIGIEEGLNRLVDWYKKYYVK